MVGGDVGGSHVGRVVGSGGFSGLGGFVWLCEVQIVLEDEWKSRFGVSEMCGCGSCGGFGWLW